MIFGAVDPAKLDDFWPVCKPILAQAFRQRVHADTVDDYYPLIKDCMLQLWVALDDKEIIGSVVTSIDKGSNAKICSILSLAGNNLKQWIGMVDRDLYQFAASNECDALEYVGRRGFSLLVPGYEEDGVVYVKVIGDEDVKKV